jgi:hypothetical protein
MDCFPYSKNIGEIDLNMQNFISMKGEGVEGNEEKNMVHNLTWFTINLFM